MSTSSRSSSGEVRSGGTKRVWRADMPHGAALALGIPMLVAFAFLVFYPAVELIITSFGDGWQGFADLFGGTELRAMRRTVIVSLIVTLISLLVGAVVAWTLRTTSSRLLAGFVWVALLGSMSMSVVVKNYAFIVILGRFGLINTILDAIGISRQSILFTPTAVTAGMVYSLIPFAVFPLFFTFRAISDDLLHAAESLGATAWQRTTTVVLPLSIPGFFVTGVVMFVFSIGFFVTPVVLGGTRATFLASMIQRDILREFDRVAAATKSVFLIVVALILVAIAVRLVGRERFRRAIG